MLNFLKIESLLVSLSPIYFVSKLFGQAPYKVTTSNENFSSEIDTINVIYVLICNLFYFVCSFCIVRNNLDGRLLKYPSILLIGKLILFIFSKLFGKLFINNSYWQKHLGADEKQGLIQHILIGLINSSTTLISSFIKAKKLSIFLNEINNIDEQLRDFCGTIRVDYRKSFILQLNCLIVSVLLFCFVGIFDYYIFQGIHGTTSIVIVTTISYSVPYLMTACVTGQYITGVHLICDRFNLINRFLNNINDENEPTNNAIKNHRELFENNVKLLQTNSNVQSDNNKQPFSITHNLMHRKNTECNNMEMNREFTANLNDIKRNNDSISNEIEKFNDCVMSTNRKSIRDDDDSNNNDNISSNKSNTTQSLLQSLKSTFKCSNTSLNEIIEQTDLNLHLRMNEIFSLHDKLCDIAEYFNDLYSIDMLFITTGSFIILIFGVFFVVQVIFWSQGLNMQLLAIATSYILWGVFVSTIIYVALRACSNAQKEMFEAAIIIHKILQNKPEYMLNDETYHGKMKSFTLQILNRKKIFHFNVFGLFRLEYTFIFSILNAGISYLIVLSHFDINRDFQKMMTNLTNTTQK